MFCRTKLIGLEELAKYPNVYCKASGMFTADPSWDVQKFVETAVKPCLDIFGMNRLGRIIILPAGCSGLRCCKHAMLV